MTETVSNQDDVYSLGEIDLTLIIPAYNEEERIPLTLQQATDFLQTLDFTWELLIADDGSTDGTADIAAEAALTMDGVRHLRLPHAGKAAAVRAGVEASRGRAVIFTDADLSTPIEYVADALKILRSGWDVVIGSREGNGAVRIGEPFYRHLMGRVYNNVVQTFLGLGIKDTQCGFKGFRRTIGHELFTRSSLYRPDGRPVVGPMVTGFDVELLFIARKLHYRIYELPVTWKHADGSKVRPGIDGILMFRDVMRVRLNDWRGEYDRA